MIVHEKSPKFVYVDPPKTGTRSMQHWILSQFRDGENVGDHRTSLPPRWRRFVVFATVRNPYERAISAWCGTILRERPGLGHAEGLVKTYGDASLLSFVRWLVDGGKLRERTPGRSWPLPCSVEFLKPIVEVVGGWKGLQILRLEDLPGQLIRLPFVCRKKAAQFPHLNRSKSRPSLYDQSAEFIDRVNAWAAADFERFGYKRIDPMEWRARSGGATPKEEVST